MLDQAKADMLERVAAIPPAIYTGATIFGVPVSDLSQWVFLAYASGLLLWHLRTKWFARWFGVPPSVEE